MLISRREKSSWLRQTAVWFLTFDTYCVKPPARHHPSLTWRTLLLNCILKSKSCVFCSNYDRYQYMCRHNSVSTSQTNAIYGWLYCPMSWLTHLWFYAERITVGINSYVWQHCVQLTVRVLHLVVKVCGLCRKRLAKLVYLIKTKLVYKINALCIHILT